MNEDYDEHTSTAQFEDPTSQEDDEPEVIENPTLAIPSEPKSRIKKNGTLDRFVKREDINVINTAQMEAVVDDVVCGSSEPKVFDFQVAAAKPAFRPMPISISKNEQFAQQLRRVNIKKILDSKRSKSNDRIAQLLSITHFNVQSIRSEERRARLSQWMDSQQPASDVYSFSETRLSDSLTLNQFTVNQTKPGSTGGQALAISSKLSSANIKYIQNMITYSSLYIYGEQVHCIGVYLPPYQQQEIRSAVKHLYWIVMHIQHIDSEAQIVVTGDFNFYLKEVASKLKELGLSRALDESVPTHVKGN